MKRRVFIVHGWDGNPEEGWFPWLKQELEAKNFKVYVPQMPDTENPRIYKWVPTLAKVISKPNQQTYLVGHSIGCQTIVRYLETLPKGQKVGGAVFVAGFFKRLTNLEDDSGVQETAKHWLSTPIDLKRVRPHLTKSIAIFSDNDSWVSADNQDDFRNKLGSKVAIEHDMGHFSGSDGIKELPIVLSSILKLSNEN